MVAANEHGEAGILEGIYEIFREQLDYQGDLQPELQLIAEAGLDSLLLVTLVVEVESRFRIILEEGDEQGVVTIADLARLVELRRAS